MNDWVLLRQIREKDGQQSLHAAVAENGDLVREGRDLGRGLPRKLAVSGEVLLRQCIL